MPAGDLEAEAKRVEGRGFEGLQQLRADLQCCQWLRLMLSMGGFCWRRPMLGGRRGHGLLGMGILCRRRPMLGRGLLAMGVLSWQRRLLWGWRGQGLLGMGVLWWHRSRLRG